MKLKYYAQVDNLQEALAYYQELFGGTIIKDGNNGHHAYIKLFDQISLLLTTGKKKEERVPGYFIIRFEDQEKNLFLKTIENIRARKEEIKFDSYAARWGTTFFEFKDQNGLMWDLEISTKAL